MAEPLSIASGLIALAAFAFKSSVTLCSTVKSFQFHPQRVRDLVEQLETLSTVLRGLTETIITTTDVDLSGFALPLQRCGDACREFEEEISACLRRPHGSRSSFRDWAKLKYMGDDIDGFRHMLVGYQSTFEIALTHANISKSSITAKVLKEYRDLIKTATDDLKARQESIDGKFEAIFARTLTDSDIDAVEMRLIREERANTQQCLQIFSQLFDGIDQIQLHPARTHEESLERQLGAMKGTSQPSELNTVELTQLHEAKERIRQSINVASAANEEGDTNSDGEIVDDHDTFQVKPLANMISARGIQLGQRSTQIVGSISNETLHEALADRHSSRLDSMSGYPGEVVGQDTDQNSCSGIPDSTVPTSVTGDACSSQAGECTKRPLVLTDDDTGSLTSDLDDIGSQASEETTYEARTGKALLGLFLVEEKATRELLEEAHAKMDKHRLTQTLRRLLKSLYKNLLIDADNELQKATSHLLRSRRGRLRISGQIVDRIQQESDGLGCDAKMVDRSHKTKVEKWLSQSDILSGGAGQQMEENHDSSSSTDNELDTDEETDYPRINSFKTYLRQSTAFLTLQKDLMLIFLPSDLRDILWTVSNKKVWTSRKQDLSMINQAKTWVERTTQMRWNWWPLTPAKRLLREGEARMFWECDCGITLWHEISNEQYRWIDRIISLPDLPMQKKSACGMRKRTESFGTCLRSILQSSSPRMASLPNSSADQRYTATGSVPVASIHSGYIGPALNREVKVKGVIEIPSNQQQPSSTHHNTQRLVHPLTQPRSWVLLGVDGAARTIFPAQIPIEEWTTDYQFFKELKKAYWKQRGWIRSWFSIWRLQYCEVLKFNRLTPNHMVREYSDFPIQEE